MKIFVGGVNGSGKTTLCRAASKEIGIPVIHATTGFMEYLDYESDYEKLRAIPSSLRDSELSNYMQTLLQSADSFILDSHYLNLVKGNVASVIGNWINDFTALVLVSAPIEDVWSRIQSDSKERDRALFLAGANQVVEKESLIQYQIKTKEMFNGLVEKYNLPHIEILNENGNAESAIKSLEEFILLFS